MEATTALSNATGGYRIDIEGDFAAQSDELPATVTAAVGLTAKHRFDNLPQDATVSAQSVSPAGLSASVTAVHGSAAVELTPDKARTTTVTVAFTASGHTTTQQITVNATCAPGNRPLQDGTCQPLPVVFPTGCDRVHLGGREWARRRYEDTWTRVFGSRCSSVSLTDQRAAYYHFVVPEGSTARSSYEMQIDIAMPIGARPAGAPVGDTYTVFLPMMDLVMWQVGADSAKIPLVPSERQYSHSSANLNTNIRLYFSVLPGHYILELVPDLDSAPTLSTAPLIGDEFHVTGTTPSGRRHVSDVALVGNTGLRGTGMTLSQFLDARGSRDYGEHPVESKRTDASNPFDPLSADYPWLPFSTDRCSIPGLVPRSSEIPLPSWQILLAAIEGETLIDVAQLVDYPTIGDVSIPFVYGCMRHDFNWRNLHRNATYVDPDVAFGTWTSDRKRESNDRFQSDLRVLCNSRQPGAPESSRYLTWRLPRDTDVLVCEQYAFAFRVGVDLVPFAVIGYDHNQ